MSQMPRYAAGPAGRIRLSTRGSGLVVALLLALIALSGCVTVQLDATVHQDGSISGTARFGVSKSLASLGGGAEAIRQRLRSEGSCDFGSAGATVHDYDDGSYVGIECSFAGISMADFNSGEDGPKLARVGNEFRLTGQLNLLNELNSSSGLLGGGTGGSASAPATSLPTGLPTDLASLLPSSLPSQLGSFLPSTFPSDLASLLPSGFPTDLPTDLSSLLPPGAAGGTPSLDPRQLLKTAKIQFAFTFPGKVRSSKGNISGNRVTFTPDATGNIDFDTVASAESAGAGTPARFWWLAVALLLAALLILASVARRRRRRSAALAAAGNQPGASQSGPGRTGGYHPGAGYSDGGYPGSGHSGGGPTTGRYPDQDYRPQGYSDPDHPQPYQPPPSFDRPAEPGPERGGDGPPAARG
ncbi:MAG TPA: hypothetical protein VHO01_03865 [Jatrophihabitans sp.]|nr:hypothetical protein [Jatrophihabitans sp.]